MLDFSCNQLIASKSLVLLSMSFHKPMLNASDHINYFTFAPATVGDFNLLRKPHVLHKTSMLRRCSRTGDETSRAAHVRNSAGVS